MLTISLSAKRLRISLTREVEAAGNNEPPSGTTGLQVRREAQDFWRGMRYVDALFNLNVFKKVVASLRAKSPKGIASLSSTAAGLLLSRLESHSALLQAFQIFRGRAELAASRPMARQCLPCQPSSSRLFVPPCRRLPLQPQTRLTLASAMGCWWFLVMVCACGGKTLIYRPEHSSWVVSITKECILRLSPPDAFIVQVMFRNLLYDICLLCGMDVLKTCNRLARSL